MAFPLGWNLLRKFFSVRRYSRINVLGKWGGDSLACHIKYLLEWWMWWKSQVEIPSSLHDLQCAEDTQNRQKTIYSAITIQISRKIYKITSRFQKRKPLKCLEKSFIDWNSFRSLAKAATSIQLESHHHNSGSSPSHILKQITSSEEKIYV